MNSEGNNCLNYVCKNNLHTYNVIVFCQDSGLKFLSN